MLRPLAMLATAVVAFTGLSQASAPNAEAVTSVKQNFITIDAPNPVRLVSLYSHYEMNSQFAKGVAWAANGGNREFKTTVVDLDTGLSVPVPGAGLDATSSIGQSYGGTGTGKDPYFVQSSRPFTGAYSNLTLTAKQTVVLGQPYFRTDLTITNNGLTPKNMQWGSYGQCQSPGGSIWSTIEPGRLVKCYGTGFETSFIPLDNEVSFVAGNYLPIRNLVTKPIVGTDNANACWVTDTTKGTCGTGSGGQSMGVFWGQEIPASSSVTHSFLTAMVDTIEFAHLVPEATVSPAQVGVGGQTTYTLKMTNQGPDNASNNVMTYKLPAGMTVVGTPSGDGTYNAATGTWTVPAIAAGTTATINIAASAAAAGSYSTTITNLVTGSIDRNPCTDDDSCGGATTVTVADQGVGSTSSIAANPATVELKDATTSTITVTAKKADGTPAGVGGATVTMNTNLGTLSGVTDNLDGTYTATLTSTTAGLATVNFTLNGAAGAAPATVQFNAGPPVFTSDAAGYSVSTGTVPVRSEHTVTVSLLDVYNNPIVGAEDRLEAFMPDRGQGTISGFSPVNATLNPGVYAAKVTSTVSGTKTVTVKLDGSIDVPLVVDGNTYAEFGPGATDLTNTNSKFSVSTGTKKVGSGTHTVTVQLADADGNPIRNAQLTPTSDKSLGDGGFGSFVEDTDDPGTYTATISSTIAGDMTISVALNGVGPVNARGGNTVAKFEAAEVDLTDLGTGFSVTTGPQSTDDGSHTATILLNDEYGNPVTLTADELATLIAVAMPSAGVTVSEVEADAATAGKYTATITSTKTGDKQVSVTLGGQTVVARGNDIAAFTHGGPAVTNGATSFEVSTGDAVAGSETHTLSISVADAGGNGVLGLTAGAFLPTADPAPGVSFSDFEDLGNGKYQFTIASTQAGVKTVSVTIGGGSVEVAENKSATASFVADEAAVSNPNAVNFSVSTGPKLADGVETHTITVRLQDANGNAVRDAAADLSAATVIQDAIGDGEIGEFTELTPGIYTATISSTVADTFELKVLYGTELVSLKPVDGNASAQFVAGAPTKGTSAIVVSPVRVQANGVSSATATVTLKDAKGNTITNVPVGTTVTGKTNLGVAGSVTQNPDGTFTFQVSSDEEGTATVGFKLNNVDADATDEVEFVTVSSPTVDYANASTVVGSGIPGETIEVRDNSGTLIGSGTVGTNGKFNVTLTTPAADGDTLKVTSVDGNGFISEPTLVKVDAIAPDAPVVDPSNGSKVTGEAEPGSTVVVKDGNGTELCRATADPEDGTFECVPNPTPGNGDTIKVTATDPSGNTSDETTVTIDTIAPDAPVVDPSNGSKVTGEAEPGSTVVVKDKDDNVLCKTTADPTDGTFECVPNPKPGQDDELKITATDPSGNTSEETTVTINQKAPNAPQVDPSNGSKVTGSAQPGSTVIVKDNDGTELCRATADAEDGTFECVPNPAPGNGDTIKVTATDKESNESDPTTVTIDTIAPEAPVVDPSNGSKVTGEAEPGSTVVVKDGNGTELCRATADPEDGTFECVPNPTPGNGDTIKVTATDPSGNTSDETTVTIDTIAPDAPVVDPSNGSKVTGEAEPGSTVVVKDKDDNVLCKTTADPTDGTFECVPNPKPGQDDELKITATDPSGNTSEETTVTINQKAPNAPQVDPSNGSKVTGSAQPGSTVIVKDNDGTELCRATADAEDGTFECVPNPAPGNGDTIKVTATDKESNESDPTTVTIDTIAPEAPVVDPSNGSKVTGEAEPDSKVTVKDKDDNVLCEAVAGPDGKFECVPNPKPGQDDELKITATDPSGNTSEETTVTINQKAPNAPQVDPSNGSKVTGSAQPGSTVIVKDNDGTELCRATADAEDGTFECVPNPAPGNGDTIKVTATDKESNESDPTTVTIDTIAPDAPVVDPSNGSKVTGEAEPGSTVVVKDKDDNVLCKTTADPTDGTFECVPNPKPGQDDELKITATDPSGNTSEETTVTINQKAPNAPQVDPSNGSKVTGSAQPGSTVIVKDNDGTELCRATADAEDGTFECVPNPAPGNGDTIKVTATDKESNESDPTTVTIDTIAPEAPVVDPSNGSKVTGEAEPDSKVTVKDKDDNVLCEAVAGPDGKFECVPNPKPGQDDELKITATDPSGNTSEETTVTIDQTLPDTPVIDLSNGKTVTGGTIAEGNTLVFVDANGKTVPGTIVIDENGRFTFTPTTPLTEEDKVEAVVTTPAGNFAKAPVKVKTHAPDAPKIDTVDGNKVTGCAEAGSTVVVRDGDGKIIGSAVVGDDCRYTIEFETPQKPGSSITVDATDGAGNVSDKAERTIGELAIVLESAQLEAGSKQVAYGYGFLPGEKVSGVLRSTPVSLGDQIADADGNVVFSFAIPADMEIGMHSVTLTGATSGSVKAEFEVIAVAAETVPAPGLAVTGADLVLPISVGILLLGAGIILGAARRRKHAEEVA
ncbi:DUF11 domain-containing protein [Leucobacter insecticola]|uniref:DUF11 domain-containing protein n=1 Tax=Leucobacter insecticola TaxID=2714934 RepID=A0A6G8FG57_9MICO|nr:Ig-like domain-containing protein [Leucobacter insecticola]QIM15348.1 DUF11 domain-containing protein [Leucobacter insecticola]